MRGRLWLNLGLAIALAVLALVAWRQPGKAPPPAEIKLTKLDTQSVRRIAFHPPAVRVSYSLATARIGSSNSRACARSRFGSKRFWNCRLR